MKSALARHDELLRAAVERPDGHVVKTTGDGTHAVFVSSRDALAAALDGQRALANEAWESTGPLRVRMAVHTGEAQERDGDYFGSALNRAARLMACAHGGQVLLSEATCGLVRDEVPAEVELVDLGEHRLRDLSRAERVFQLRAPGIEGEFAHLRSLDAYPGNLPVQLTSFVGREDDIGAVLGALREARIVTLTGVGGVGKTRLALQVAGDVLPGFPEGAWLCELAPVTDGSAVIDVVAAALNIEQRQGQTLEDSVLEALRAKGLLLVLDNCEHLIDPVAKLVQTIVAGCPHVEVLATSREGLGISGERLIAVRSLAVPADAGAEAIAGSEAVRLFVARAADAKHGFVISDENASAITEICRRLDGIP